MNKIVMNFGLLIFFLCVFIFSQKGMAWDTVLLRSFVIFMVVTVMGSFFAMAFIKAINKTSIEKSSTLGDDKLLGRKNHE